MEIDLEFPSFRSAKGVWEHHIRQSDINDFRECPEKFRQTRHGEVAKWENDSAVVGTACHLAYQSLLEGWVDSMADAIEVALTELAKLWPTCRRVQIKSEEHARESVIGCIHSFVNEVMDSLLNDEVLATEIRFNVLANETPSRKLYLSGTSDVWTKRKLVDFKHSARDWAKDAWKIERYNVQSTLYVWARDQVEIKADQGRKFSLDYAWEDEFYPFEFIVISPETFNVYRQTVQRRVKDARFLHDEIQAMCDAIEYLPKNRWPKRSEDWQCSPKWCPAWSNCRGKYLGPDPWGLMEKAERITGVPASAEIPSSKVIEGLTQMVKAKPPTEK